MSVPATLATTAPLDLRRKSDSPAVLPAHQRTGTNLAARILREKHASEASTVALLRSLKLTRLKYSSAGDHAILGWARHETSAEVYSLFFVAERSRGATYRTAYLNYYGGPVRESANMGFEFVDALDINGDGQQEIVFSYSGYEWWGYGVLQRRGVSWVVAHRQAVGGC